MTVKIIEGDALAMLRTLPAGTFQTCVTSPPYFGLRSYLPDQHPDKHLEIGREETPAAYVAGLVNVFAEMRRVLRTDATFWLNLGDTYSDNKQRLMIPARVALALQADGWLLRDEIVWHKPRTTPSSVTDRTCPAHEMLYMFAKNEQYFYDYLAIEDPALYPGVIRKRGKAFRAHGKAKAKLLNGADKAIVGQGGPGAQEFTVRETRRKRSVWSINPQPYSESHFATFPPDLVEPCILAGSRKGDAVLDPFGGAGTTALVADRLGRDATIIELNPDSTALSRRRITGDSPLFAEVEHAAPQQG